MHQLRARVAEALGDLGGAVAGVGELLGEGRQVVLAVGVLTMWAMSWARWRTKKRAAAEQVAGLALGPGVDVGHREDAAAEQAGDLAGVDLVVLGLAAVDGLHGQGVAEDEGDALRASQRSASQYQANMHSQPTTRSLRKGSMASRKASGSAGRSWSKTVLPSGVEDVDEHGSGVQIDAAVECGAGWL